MQRPSSWIFQALCPDTKQTDAKKRASKKRQSCFVPLADVLLFESSSEGINATKKGQGVDRRKPSAWLFTGDNAKVTCKAGTAMSWSKLRDSFLRLADQMRDDGENTKEVCTVYMGNGTSHKLDKTTFLALIAGAKRDGGLSSVEMMQASVAGGSQKEQLRCRTTYSKEMGSETTIIGGVPASVLDVETALDGVTRDLIDNVQNATNTQILSIDITFAADRDGVLRVSGVNNVITTASKGERPSRAEKAGSGDARDEGGKVDKDNNRGGKKKGGSKKMMKKRSTTQSTPELPGLSKKAMSTGANSATSTTSTSSNSATPANATCKGDFCGLSVDYSNSLNILDLDPPSQTNLKALTWDKELDRVRATSSSKLHRTKRKVGTPTRNSEPLHRIGQRQILLARNQMHYVTGGIRQTDSTLRDDIDFARSWQQMDNKLQYELGMKHPDQFYQDTWVCANCFSVYSKIEHLRNTGFEVKDRPGTESNKSDREHMLMKLHHDPNRAELSTAPDERLIPVVTEQVKEEKEEEEEHITYIEQLKMEEKKKLKARPMTPETDEPEVKAKTAKSPMPSRLNQMMQSQMYNSSSNNTNNRLSKAENDYLMRHGSNQQRRDEENSQKLEQLEQAKLRQEHEMLELKKVRDKQLEEISKLKTKLERISGEMSKQEREIVPNLQDELRVSRDELNNAKRGFVKAMKDKEEEVARLQLELDQARHTMLAATGDASQLEDEDSLSRKLMEANKARISMTRTIDELNHRIDELESENRKLHTDMERQHLESSERAASQWKQESTTFKRNIDSLESEIQAKQTVIRDLQHNLDLQKTKEGELKRQVSLLGSEKHRLQEELAAATQSLKSITSLGSSEDAAIAAVRATCEAKVAELKNELEFMQQQARCEASFVEELKQSLSEAKMEITKQQAKHKQELEDLENEKKLELSSTREEFEKELQVPRNQIRLLEDKVAELQTALARMHNEMDAARRKLQVSEQDHRRAKEECKRLEQDRLSMERNLAELQATVAASAQNEGDRQREREHEAEMANATNAAKVRQLENQLAYLQKQLQVEKSVKEELNDAIEKSRAQLKQTLNEWKLDAEQKDTAHRAEVNSISTREIQLRDEKLQLQMEVKNLLEQLEELRENYAKAKDQLEVDQNSLEESSQQIQRLRQELASSKKLANALDAQAIKSAESHRLSMKTLQDTIDRLEKERNQEVDALRAKLSDAHKDLSNASAQMLSFRNSAQSETLDFSKRQAARLLFSTCIARWSKIDLLRGFKALERHSQVISIVEKAGNDVMRIQAQHRVELERKIEEVRTRFQSSAELELRQQIEQVRLDGEMRCKEISDMAIEDKIATIKVVEAEHQRKLAWASEEQQSKHAKEMELAESESKKKLAKLESAHRAERQACLRQAENEKIAALEQAAKEFDSKLQTEIDSVRAAYENQMRTMKQDRDNEHAHLKKVLRDEKERALKKFMETAKSDTQSALSMLEKEKNDELEKTKRDLTEAHEKALTEALEQSEEKLQGALKEAEAKHNAELEQRVAQLEEEMRTEFAKARRDAQTKSDEDIQKLEEQHRETTRNMWKDFDQKFNEQTEQHRKDLEEKIAKVREEAQAERANALKLSTQKWQTIMSECTNESMMEQERLVKEHQREKANALREAKENFEKEIQSRDQTAARAQARAIEEMQQKTKLELEELEERLHKEHETRLVQAVKEVKAEEEAALIRVEAEKQRLLQAQKRKLQEEWKRVLAKKDQEHENALTVLSRESAGQMEAAMNKARKEAQEHFETEKRRWEQIKQDAENAILEQSNKVTEQKLLEAQMQMQEAVMKCRQQCEERFGKEIQGLQREKEEFEERAQQELEDLKREKKRLNKELQHSQDLLEESEDMAYDLQNNVAKMNRINAFMALKMKLQNAKALAAFCNFRKQAEKRWAEQLRHSQGQLEERITAITKQLERTEEKLGQHQAMEREVHDVLVNYKRNELMQHKVDSAVLQDDLKKLQGTKESTEKQYAEMNKEISLLEGQIKEVEKQMQEMSRVSAIQDGKINVTHAKRKRRLDQEFEHLLDRAAHRKEQLSNVERKIENIEEQASLKEEKLKELEANLVQILVEQQKKLLHILTVSSSSSNNNNNNKRF